MERPKAMKRDAFSLIELLIVIAIILVIAMIAIPNLIRSRISANEASAVGSLRTINEGERVYFSTYNTGYSPNLQSLGPGSDGPTASAAGLIDSVLAGTGSTSTKNGYTFTYSSKPDTAGRYNVYTLTAAPSKPGTTGVKYYYTDQTSTIRQSSGRQAGASDTPYGQ